MHKLGTMTIVLTFAGWSVAAQAVAAPQALRGDAAAGAKVFVQCKMCHATAPGVNRIGPLLAHVVGRKAAIQPGFMYSAAMKSSGITWTETKLADYLASPRLVVPGTKMSFVGLKKPQDRADIIAYLKTQ